MGHIYIVTYLVPALACFPAGTGVSSSGKEKKPAEVLALIFAHPIDPSSTIGHIEFYVIQWVLLVQMMLPVTPYIAIVAALAIYVLAVALMIQIVS